MYGVLANKFPCQEFFCHCGCSGRHTFDAILEVFVWSLSVCFEGKWPSQRHDETSFDDVHNRGFSVHKDKPASQTWRVQQANQPLGFKALLQQCRGDWMWYKELFSFPSWASNQLCWRCEATQENFRDFGLKAAWRKQRVKPVAFFGRQRAQGLEPSPLFRAMGFSLDMVLIDVLHCMDLGCTQDILGNICFEALQWVCKGSSRKEQVSDLWGQIQQYYKEFSPPTMLQGLTVEMIKRQKKAPKLKAKGAETRHLVPFGVLLAIEMQKVRKDTHANIVLKVAEGLFGLYELFSVRPVPHQAIADGCRRLCLLYSSLNPGAADTQDPWRVKPKFHMMCELCEYQAEYAGSPEEFWAYADESFVGFVAEFSHKRGGAANASSTSEGVLNRFRAISHRV